MKQSNDLADHYETLQLNPLADRETIDSVYRILAKRYHPDNQESADAAKLKRLPLHTVSYQIRNNARSMMPHTRIIAVQF